MAEKDVNQIIHEFYNSYGIKLLKLNRKRIIYDGVTKNGDSIVVLLPKSKLYKRGNGWVDITKVQTDLLKKYSFSIIVFRIENGKTYYVDFDDLSPLLNQKNMLFNNRAGEHWKIDIWSDKLTIRTSKESINIKENYHSFANKLKMHNKT